MISVVSSIFGDLYLNKTQVKRLGQNPYPEWIPRTSFSISKASLVAGRFDKIFTSKFGEQSKFYYVGKSERDYSGYSAERSSLEREFVSYQFKKDVTGLDNQDELFLDTSANLFDVYSSTQCKLEIENIRMESLHVNMLPLPADRLTGLNLKGVHLEHFDPDILTRCTHLEYLILRVTFSKQVNFELDFLRAFTMLNTLELTLPDSTCDFSVFSKLPSLSALTLTSSSVAYAQPFRKLTREALEHIFLPPKLSQLALSYFDIETIDWMILSQCQDNLSHLDLRLNRIGRIDWHAFAGFGIRAWWAKLSVDQSVLTDWNWDALKGPNHMRVLSMIDVGIRTLEKSNFDGLVNLSELNLSYNSISELSPGVFGSMQNLDSLCLHNNAIEQVKIGSFEKLSKLETINISGNPIKTIEANAFSPLVFLKTLHLSRCQLKSIDSEIFVGLENLTHLRLNDNLIESIQVVTEDGRRINVAKASLNDKEKELASKYLFRGLSRLKYLHMKGNQLKKLDLSCFVNLTALSELDLSSNSMSELNTQASLLPALRFLYLIDNLLKTVDMSALPASLKSVYLTGNNLSHPGDGVIDSKLIVYSRQQPSYDQMPRNTAKITTLTREVVKLFATATVTRGFTYLDFSENFIETLDNPGLFDGFLNVTWIKMSNNRLSRLHRDIFKNLPSLRIIDLSMNRLSSVDLGIFRGLYSLTNLDLSSNSISFFNLARLFRICPRLENLNIADNQLDDRSTAELIGSRLLISIWHLNLAGNRLEKMDFVRHMSNLSRLNLRGNRIESVVSDGYNTLGRLSALIHLDLSENRIRSLRDEMFAHLWGRLQHLNISGNPLDFQIDSVLMELI